MKFLTMVLILVFLSACGKSGDGGVSSGPGGVPTAPVDNSPHNYIAGYTVLSDYGQDHNAVMRQICNFGLTGARDESASYSIVNPSGGENRRIGCDDARNYTFEITNTGAVNLNVTFEIDGAYKPEFDRVVVPGETYTFQRGF